ncbi:MAG: hypothetical protein K6T83_10195 [Alicyclobacillus sp.]|nr:hypothetical protein [Alicyclobacillus sp.]
MDQQIRLRAGQDDGRELSLAQMLSTLDSLFGENHQIGTREYSAYELYEAFIGGTTVPTSFEVCGTDGFYARITWRSADSATFRFPDASAENETSGVRLFVRDSENACLNVKSIVDIHFNYQAT